MGPIFGSCGASRKCAEVFRAITCFWPALPTTGSYAKLRSELILLQWALRDSNPRPHGCDAASDPSQDVIQPEDTTPANSVCTPVCTNETKAATLEALAAALRSLSAADRARLAALLVQKAMVGEDSRQPESFGVSR